MRVFIIHGFQGEPNSGWKPWVAERLRAKGYEVYVPAMPNPNHPVRAEWVETIRATIGTPQPTDILIGHSLGTIASLRYLESLNSGEKIAKTILVAGFFEDLGEQEIANFTDTPVDFAAVRSHCDSFSVIHSDDDDSVPLPFAQNLARELHVPIELHHGYGHFSSGDGVFELPLLLEKI